MKAIVCVGISSSGKSTFAMEWTADNIPARSEINRDWVRFNIVCPGEDWGSYKMTKHNERLVSEYCDKQLHSAASLEKDVIISDTHLNEKYRNILTDKLVNLGYDVEIKEFPVSLEEAWKRDSLRINGVGHSVIYKQYLKWLEYKKEQRYVPNPSLPKTVICDVDGTVAINNGKRGFYEWDKVGSDDPRSEIIQMVKGLYSQGYKVLFVSGRDAVCYNQTRRWLDENIDFSYVGLLMRDQGDMRKDSIVKKEIFFRDIVPYYNVLFAIDDRPQVVRAWYEIGIPNVICVGNPWIEF